MSQWKRVLLSGSHFSVRELTISDIPTTATTGDTILLAVSASTNQSGSFTKPAGFVLTNNGTVFSGSFGNAQTSFEGDGSGITGITSATTLHSLKPGAGFGFVNNGGADSTFTGGSTRTMVPFLLGSTLGTSANYAAPEAHSQAQVNAINAGNTSGLFFVTESSATKLSITSSLPGNGLEFKEPASEAVFSRMRIKRDGDSDTEASGLALANNGLKLSFGDVAGQGLAHSAGVLSLDIAADGGLGFGSNTVTTATDDQLGIKSTLAGPGLTFAAVNDFTEINIATTYAVSSSVKLTLDPGGSNQLSNTISGFAGNNHGVIAVNSVNSFSSNQQTNPVAQELGNNPIYHLRLNTTFGNDGTAVNSDFSITPTTQVTIKGDLLVLSSSNVTSIHADEFLTSDPFILISSGSETVSNAFASHAGGIIVQTANTNGQASGSAIFQISGSSKTIYGVTTAGAVSWDDTDPGTTTGDVIDHSSIATLSIVKESSFPNPNTAVADGAEQGDITIDVSQDLRGQWYIEDNRDPAGDESNVWIYDA